MRLSILAAFASAVALFVACRENPSIDGSRVATVANPTCPQACDRLKSLCGYPPVDCVKACEDGYDETHRACIGNAVSCKDALENCASEETDGGDEAGEEDAAQQEDDASPIELDAGEDVQDAAVTD